MTKVTTILDINENWQIEHLQGFYRYVNHKEKLVTTGFRSKNKLIANKNGFLDSPNVREIMTTRYVGIYG